MNGAVERHRFPRTHDSLGGPGVTVFLAGMQSHGADQASTIQRYLPGDVRTYNAIGKKFHPDRIADAVISDIQPYVDDEQPVRFVGASMGGMLTPFVMSELLDRNDGMNTEQLRALVVDSPAGRDTLVNKQSHLLGNHVVATVLEHAPGIIKAPIFIPKKGDVTIPRDLLTSPENYEYQFRQSARQRLSGFALSLWADEINWMNDIVKDGSLPRACRALAGVSMRYLMCTGKNDAVLQPRAATRWTEWNPGMMVDYVSARHCAFHQDNPQFAQYFKSGVFH